VISLTNALIIALAADTIEGEQEACVVTKPKDAAGTSLTKMSLRRQPIPPVLELQESANASGSNFNIALEGDELNSRLKRIAINW
jgi:hypothetical protein